MAQNGKARIDSVVTVSPGGDEVVESFSSGWGAITFGNYIVGQNGIHADPEISLFQHEYGHYIQSQRTGPAYYARYGIPSMLSNPERHNHHPVEQDANIRAFNYFNRYVENFSGTDENSTYHGMWKYKVNPIDGMDWQNYYNSRNAFLLQSRLTPSFFAYLAGFAPVLGDFLYGGIQSIIDNNGNY